MKRLFLWLAAIAAVGCVGAGAFHHFHGSRVAGDWRTMPVRRGEIKVIVNSTGTVQPVLSVQVGASVSGPIQKVYVDFNDQVKAKQVLAKIDPRTYQAALAHEEAALAHAQADLDRLQALLEQAVHNERRTVRLVARKAIAESDAEQSVTERKSLEAQVHLGQAAIRECEANLTTAKTNLDFTDIRSPVDGVVTDRKVDSGQTVAAQFQTPVMFVVAPDLEKKVYVYASVDEADIGLIREAQSRKEPVTFTVDAYLNDEFTGKIFQVRLNPTTVQNVVTYTVIVEAANPGMKLLPGMTANLAFQIEKCVGVLTVPNAALRFRPKPEQVRPSDRAILESVSSGPAGAAASSNSGSAARQRNLHYVWIADGDLLAAVEIAVGRGDKISTELVSGSLSEGQELVVGAQVPGASNSSPPP
jgi:HlyD family secretion protein